MIILLMAMVIVSMADEKPVVEKSPVLAGTLAILPLGVGHAYAGNWLRGLGFSLTEMGLLLVGGNICIAGDVGGSKEALTIGTGIILAAIPIKIWEISDAVHIANKYNKSKSVKVTLGIAPIQNNVGLNLAYRF